MASQRCLHPKAEGKWHLVNEGLPIPCIIESTDVITVATRDAEGWCFSLSCFWCYPSSCSTSHRLTGHYVCHASRLVKLFLSASRAYCAREPTSKRPKPALRGSRGLRPPTGPTWKICYRCRANSGKRLWFGSPTSSLQFSTTCVRLAAGESYEQAVRNWRTSLRAWKIPLSASAAVMTKFR